MSLLKHRTYTVTLLCVLQVLYNLFDGLSAIGANNIEGIDVGAGILSFFVIVTAAPGFGIVLGFIGGFISRFTHKVPIMEPLIVIIICYMAFIIPETFHLSGILGSVISIRVIQHHHLSFTGTPHATPPIAKTLRTSAVVHLLFRCLSIHSESERPCIALVFKREISDYMKIIINDIVSPNVPVRVSINGEVE